MVTPDPGASGLDVVLKRFDRPDEIREMPKGRFEIVLPAITVRESARCRP
jgi:hypothetical protein